MRIELGTRYRCGQRERGQAGRRGQIGDVEQRDLRAADMPHRVRLAADPDQPRVRRRVQIGRIAGQGDRAADARLRRVTQVHGVEGVGLPEGDHIADGPMKRTE